MIVWRRATDAQDAAVASSFSTAGPRAVRVGGGSADEFIEVPGERSCARIWLGEGAIRKQAGMPRVHGGKPWICR